MPDIDPHTIQPKRSAREREREGEGEHKERRKKKEAMRMDLEEKTQPIRENVSCIAPCPKISEKAHRGPRWKGEGERGREEKSEKETSCMRNGPCVHNCNICLRRRRFNEVGRHACENARTDSAARRLRESAGKVVPLDARELSCKSSVALIRDDTKIS